MPPVLDSLDNYKILSEKMNVLTIYLPWWKLPVASNLRIVKTAVLSIARNYEKIYFRENVLATKNLPTILGQHCISLQFGMLFIIRFTSKVLI